MKDLPMLRSMTGFASGKGTMPPYSWTWELRSVNGKGQDIRLRLPDWITGLEMPLRKKLAAATARGNITFSLRLSREETASSVQVNYQQLQAVLAALSEIEESASSAQIKLAPSRATDIAGLRGVLEAGNSEEETTELMEQLISDADALIEAFNTMRETEGDALQNLLLGQLDEVETLIAEADGLVAERSAESASILQRNLARVLENADAIDEYRIAQELALIAVKADVTEEIDRLRAHVAAARDLIGQGGPVGRKLDFMMQEFNREANTLCAKAQNKDLTRCGLALKAIIDQMREQVQNVE
jgi:uncharacterized protein (TIGR00255 family)